MLVFGQDVLSAMPAQFVSIRVEVKVYSNSNYWNKLSSPVYKLSIKEINPAPPFPYPHPFNILFHSIKLNVTNRRQVPEHNGPCQLQPCRDMAIH